MIVTAAQDDDGINWFRVNAGEFNVSKTIKFTAEAAPSATGSAASAPKPTVTIISAIITPAPPPDSILTVIEREAQSTSTGSGSSAPAPAVSYPDNQGEVMKVTLNIPATSDIGDPGFEVIAINYSSGGTPGEVKSFDEVPHGARVSRYLAGQPQTKYTLTVTATETGATSPEVHEFKFGCEPNYTTGRDALRLLVSQGE